MSRNRRRGGGQISYLPTDISGLALWLRADTGVFTTVAGSTPSTSGAAVQRWEDQSGNARHFSNAAGLVRQDALWSKPACKFNGSNQALGPVNLSGITGGAEIFFITKVDSDPPAGIISSPIMFGTAAASPHYPYTDGVIWDTFATNVRKTVGNPAAALNTLHMSNIVSINGEYTFFLNGTQIYTTATNTFALRSDAYLGYYNPYYWGPGDLCEVIMYSGGKLSPSDKAKVKSYIASRYSELTLA